MSQPASQVKFSVFGLLCECLTISDYEGSNWKWISDACALNSCPSAWDTLEGGHGPCIQWGPGWQTQVARVELWRAIAQSLVPDGLLVLGAPRCEKAPLQAPTFPDWAFSHTLYLVMDRKPMNSELKISCLPEFSLGDGATHNRLGFPTSLYNRDSSL